MSYKISPFVTWGTSGGGKTATYSPPRLANKLSNASIATTLKTTTRAHESDQAVLVGMANGSVPGNVFVTMYADDTTTSVWSADREDMLVSTEL